MGRTRAVVIDQDDSWTIREELTLNPDDPTAPEDDYIVVDTGFPVHDSALTGAGAIGGTGTMASITTSPATARRISSTA